MKRSLLERGKTPARLVILVILSLWVSVTGQAEARSLLDDPLDRVVSVLNTMLTPPCISTQTRDCAKVTKNGGLVNVSDDRMVNQARERTSISVLASLTVPDAQVAFQQKAKFYIDPANNVFHGTLFASEMFAAGSGPTQDAVLQVSLSPNDSQQGDAIGYLVCGTLGVELSMTLFHPSTTGVAGQQAVSNTQRELKTLMQKLQQAMQGAGACNGTAQPPPPAFPAPKPVLATLAAVDSMRVSIKPWSSVTPSDTRWQLRPSLGTELHYGDVVCLQGRGSLQLKWYDGTLVNLSDPTAGIDRGKSTNCIEIGVKRPEDIQSPGVIRTGATYILEMVTRAAPAVFRMAVESAIPKPEDPPDHIRFTVEFGERSFMAAVKGTIFVMGEDVAQGASMICAEDHVVAVTPRNASLAPFDLQPGNQVRVTAGAVGPITPGCTLPSNAPVAQPDTSATGMTLQAARRTVIAGGTVLVPVWLVNADNLANLNFALSYDAAVVQSAGDPVKGDLLDNTLFKANANQQGSILAGLAQTSPLRGTGTVVNIPFRATGQPGDVTELLLTVTSINDPNGGVLSINRIAGEISIAGPDGKVPSGSGPGGSDPGSSGGSAPGPADLQKGDCDGDGFITELDALCTLEMSTQLRPSNLLMDIDNSGDVTSRDAVIILQRALGK